MCALERGVAPHESGWQWIGRQTREMPTPGGGTRPITHIGDDSSEDLRAHVTLLLSLSLSHTHTSLQMWVGDAWWQRAPRDRCLNFSGIPQLDVRPVPKPETRDPISWTPQFCASFASICAITLPFRSASMHYTCPRRSHRQVMRYARETIRFGGIRTVPQQISTRCRRDHTVGLEGFVRSDSRTSRDRIRTTQGPQVNSVRQVDF